VVRQELVEEERPFSGAELDGERPTGRVELGKEERPAGCVEAASRPVYEAEGHTIS
jgi:hypothetical protein